MSAPLPTTRERFLMGVCVTMRSQEVQPKLNTSDAGVARFEGLPFMTSAGPCTVKTAFGGTIK